jgi:hypothetical protein
MSYYKVDELELEIVAELGDGGGYDWCVALVLKHPSTGKLYGWAGCGCSCYGPLDGVYTLADLDEVHTVEDAKRLTDEVSTHYYDANSLLYFLGKVRSALC